jgi:mannose-6-phosphate isomerase-like protein (cupin superfamily)
MSDQQSNYTIKKLTETKDSAADFGISEMGEAYFATDELDAERTGFSLQIIKPGQRQPFGHVHEKAEEVYVVIQGSGRVKLDDEIAELGELDALRVAPGVTRAFESGPEGMRIIAFGARHEGDGDIVPGWWSD